MLSSFSSNVISAKIRSKFGDRLKDKDYQALLSCKKVTDIANYLKTSTYYSKVLKNVDVTNIHRRQLETILSGKLLVDFQSLLHYSSFEEDFLHVYTLMFAFEYVTKAVVCIKSGGDMGFAEVAGSFTKNSRLDFRSLSQVKTPDELLHVLEGTEIYPVLKSVIGDKKDLSNFYEIENALYTLVLRRMLSIADKFKGKKKENMKRFLMTVIDSANYTRMLRLKKSYNLSPEELNKFFIPLGNLINDKKFKASFNMSSFNEVKRTLDTTQIGKQMSNFECSYLDELSIKLVSKMSYHFMRYSFDYSLLVVSYAFFSEIELMNIIHIIEGIRYGVNRIEIERLLIKQ